MIKIVKFIGREMYCGRRVSHLIRPGEILLLLSKRKEKSGTTLFTLVVPSGASIETRLLKEHQLVEINSCG